MSFPTILRQISQNWIPKIKSEKELPSITPKRSLKRKYEEGVVNWNNPTGDLLKTPRKREFSAIFPKRQLPIMKRRFSPYKVKLKPIKNERSVSVTKIKIIDLTPRS